MVHSICIDFRYVTIILFLLLNKIEGISFDNRRLSVVSNSTKPVMNTFFERIPWEKRFTGMKDNDEDELLEFWKLAWMAAGWEPRILNRKDASDHPEYEAFLQNLTSLNLDSFGEIIFMRHFVMGAVGGGFLADFDSFPLRDFRSDGLSLPFNGEFTIYDIFAVNLASGSTEAWLEIAKALVDDARKYVRGNQTSFWTDTLGLLNLFRLNEIKIHSQREVLHGSKALNGIPLTMDQCRDRPLRGKRTLHLSPSCMILGDMESGLRLPYHRVTLARQWLGMFSKVCLNRTTEFH
jgi:hypothetical protein